MTIRTAKWFYRSTMFLLRVAAAAALGLIVYRLMQTFDSPDWVDIIVASASGGNLGPQIVDTMCQNFSYRKKGNDRA